MEVKIIRKDKKKYIDLLLLADEQESMIDKYLERGEMFALYDDDLKSICVVTKEADNVYEIKNIATYEKYQGKGYGKRLINYIFEYYKRSNSLEDVSTRSSRNKGKCITMLVGTGESDRIISFYESCGFEISHRVKNFFIDNYDHPMFENGEQLIDMIYLKKDILED